MKRILLLSLICLAAAQTVVLAAVPSSIDLMSRCGIDKNMVLKDQVSGDSTLPPVSSNWRSSGSGTKQAVLIEPGNYGIQFNDATDGGFIQYSKSFDSTEYAVAARFTVNSTNGTSNLLQISGKWTSPAAAIGIRNGHYSVIQYNSNTAIADLGAVTLGQYVEAGLYVDSFGGVVGYWLNSLGNNYQTFNLANTGAHVEFGAGTYQGPQGITNATFDWVGVYTEPTIVPEPGSLVALSCGFVGLFGIICRRRS